MKLATPLVHLNGTPKQSLLDPLLKAYEETAILYHELALTAPNGRDYYPLGAQAFEAAREEHFNRLTSVQRIREELEELINAIEAQGVRP